jgi:hypothetical protein
MGESSSQSATTAGSGPDSLQLVAADFIRDRIAEVLTPEAVNQIARHIVREQLGVFTLKEAARWLKWQSPVSLGRAMKREKILFDTTDPKKQPSVLPSSLGFATFAPRVTAAVAPAKAAARSSNWRATAPHDPPPPSLPGRAGVRHRHRRLFLRHRSAGSSGSYFSISRAHHRAPPGRSRHALSHRAGYTARYGVTNRGGC